MTLAKLVKRFVDILLVALGVLCTLFGLISLFLYHDESLFHCLVSLWYVVAGVAYTIIALRITFHDIY